MGRGNPNEAPDRSSNLDILLRALDMTSTDFAVERGAIELDPRAWIRRRLLALGWSPPEGK